LSLGFPIAYGTDSAVYPRGDNARQFAVMVREGTAPLAAIQSATIRAAELMGWEDRVGSVEPGKFADLIAVRENPLENVRSLEHVAFVKIDGRVVRNNLQ